MLTQRTLPDWKSSLVAQGKFWLPGNENLEFPGTLTLENGQPQLTLTAPQIGQEVFAFGPSSTVFGTVQLPDGPESVSLWDRAGHLFRHENNGTDHTQNYTHVLFGQHAEVDATFAFSAASFHGLGGWSRFRNVIPAETRTDFLTQHPIGTIVSPYDGIFAQDYTVRVRLEFPSRVEANDRAPDGMIVNHPDEITRISFEVDPPAPVEVHDLLSEDLQALLTFCYQSGAPVTGQWIGNAPAQLLTFANRNGFRDRITHRLGHFQTLISPREYPFDSLVEGWWRVIEADFPAPQVITTYLHGTRGLLEQSTASVLAAIEDLHSRVGPTHKRVPAAEFARYRPTIRAALPGRMNAPLRAVLYENLGKNRPTLALRLHELIELVGISRMATLGIDPVTWTALFTAIRNKLAHTGAHVPRRGDPSSDLELVNIQSRAILSLLLLVQMGAPDTVLDRAAEVLAQYPHRMW